MYLAYMDECGNTGTFADPDQPIHFLGCLLVEDVAVRPFEDAIRAIAQKHFPEKSKHPRFEFHGVDLFGGNGFFKGTKPEKRIEVTRELIAAASEHASAYGYTGLNKLKSAAKDHPHRICFSLMAERLEPWLKARDSLALIISDENHEMEQDLIKDIQTFKTTSTTWGYRRVPVTRVIDSIHFVKSYNNPVIQVADVLTYLIHKQYLTTDGYRAEWKEARKDNPHLELSEYIDRHESRAERETRRLVSNMNVAYFRAKVWPA